MLVFSAIFLCLAASVQAKPLFVTVYVNWTATCFTNGDVPFLYEVQLFENDSTSANDFLGRVEGEGTKFVLGEIETVADVEDPGAHLEFIMMIRHNCGQRWREKVQRLEPDCLKAPFHACDYLNEVIHLE